MHPVVRAMRGRGVAMIYQELALAPHLTVEANVMLGQERVRAGFIRRGEHRRVVTEALALLEHPDIRPEARVGDLGVGAQQLVEVARALVSNARVIVFDEPTSTLAERDAERLFAIVDRLRRRGLAIIYISHFLEEVRRVAQTYTVLRDGRAVAAGELAGTPLKSIITHMVGRDLDELFPHVPHTPGESILELDGPPRPEDGETGEPGGPARRDRRHRRARRRGTDQAPPRRVRARAGRLGTGPRPAVRGRFCTAEAPHRAGSRASERRPQDRGAGSGPLDRGQRDLFGLRRHARWGWLRLKERRAEVARWIARLRINATGPGQTVASLSGGNQQKVALARLLHQQADVLLLDEPTRGIDVGSKAEIYRLIGEQAALGKAILVVSSYLPELFGICDRIAVMSRGALCEARPVSLWTEHEVMDVATRGDSDRSAVIG